MVSTLWSSFAAIAIGLAPTVGMARENVCEKVPFTDVTSISALPVALQTAIAVGSPRRKIAEVNGPFNSTDLIFADIPDQRFRSGKLAQNCAVISLERGGSHHSRITIVFERNDNTWAESTRTVTPPQWFQND